jgi:ubiquitin carboxyl-terminal hydrolase 10
MPPVDQHEATSDKPDLPAQTGQTGLISKPEHIASVSTSTPTVAQSTLTRSETPSTQDLPSEDAVSTSPTTPSSVQPTSTTASVTPTSSSKPASRPAVPAVPIIPAVPKAAPKHTPTEEKASAETGMPSEEVKAELQQPQPAPPATKTGPKLWTGLFANPAPVAAPKPPTSSNGTAPGATVPANGNGATETTSSPGSSTVPNLTRSSTSSLAEALRSYRVGGGEKLSFIEPRGLINTGNMCYMNSVGTLAALFATYY